MPPAGDLFPKDGVLGTVQPFIESLTRSKCLLLRNSWRKPPRGFPGIALRERAVAVLVFLAGAAGAGLVAADLAPGRGILRVAVFGGDDCVAVLAHQKGCLAAFEIILAGGAVNMRAEHVGRFRRGCLGGLA